MWVGVGVAKGRFYRVQWGGLGLIGMEVEIEGWNIGGI